MLPDRSILRPTFADVFADESLSGVEKWIDGLKGRITPYAYDTFRKSLPDGEDGTLHGLLKALAHKANISPLAMVNDLQSVLDWPVDDDLYAILKSHVSTVMSSVLRRRQIEWVMKSGTRFNPKSGDSITFYDTSKNANRRGKVLAVDRPVASAIVEVGETKVTVEAERIVA